MTRRAYITTLLLILLALFYFMGEVALVVSINSSTSNYNFQAIMRWQHVVMSLMALFIYSSSFIGPISEPTTAPASLRRRFASFALDFILYVILFMAPYALLALLIEFGNTSEFAWSVKRNFSRPSDTWIAALSFVMMFGIAMLFALPVSKGRQSPGNVVTDIQIASKKPLSLMRSTRRSILGYITLCAGIISIPMVLKREDRRMWHDLHYDTSPVRRTDGGQDTDTSNASRL